MITKRNALILFLFLVLAGSGFTWWITHRAATAGNAESAEPAAQAVSALVKTLKIEQHDIDSSLTAYGDVMSAKLDTLSFPQAGQLTSMLVQPGQQLRKGEVLALLSTDPAAYAVWQQAVSAVSFAQAELHREEEMFTLKLLTQTQLDTARRQLQDAQAILASQEKLGGKTETAQLLAPVDGVITALVAAQGDRLPAGGAVLQMGESDRLRIQLGIEPSQHHLLRAGMKIAISTIQNPEAVIAARIAEVQNIVDPKSQLVNAIVLLPASATLVPGMRVQGIVQLGHRKAWLTVRSAVLNDEKGAYIFQVAHDKAQRVAVTKISETATQFGLDGDIDPTLPVVISGNYELEDDMSVREEAK